MAFIFHPESYTAVLLLQSVTSHESNECCHICKSSLLRSFSTHQKESYIRQEPDCTMHSSTLMRSSCRGSELRRPMHLHNQHTVPRKQRVKASASAQQAATQSGTNGSMQTGHASNGWAELPEVAGPRVGTVKRQTKETRVEVRLNIDGTGKCITNTPVGFFNHMIDQIASHGLFDIYINADGDTWIDDHHTVEDIALAFGSAFSQALGDRKGIHRFGEFTAPLDEALTHVVLDLSGRAHLSCNLQIPAQKIGNFDTELVEHFFMSFANTSGTTLHIRQLAGKNSHHIVEATFKAFARALRRATEYDERRRGQIASSKGVLTQQ